MSKPASTQLQDREFHDAIGSPHSASEACRLLLQRLDCFNAPAAGFTENGAGKPNEINEQEFENHPGPRSAPPLNLLGGGQHRFVGAQTDRRGRVAAAVIAAELGVPAEDPPIVSRDGVRCFRVPRRAR